MKKLVLLGVVVLAVSLVGAISVSADEKEIQTIMPPSDSSLSDGYIMFNPLNLTQEEYNINIFPKSPDVIEVAKKRIFKDVDERVDAASFILSHQDMFAGETLRVFPGIFWHKDINVIEVAKKTIISQTNEKSYAAAFVLENRDLFAADVLKKAHRTIIRELFNGGSKLYESRIIEAASFILSHQDMFAGETLRVPSGIFWHKDINVIEVAKKTIISQTNEKSYAAAFVLENRDLFAADVLKKAHRTIIRVLSNEPRSIFYESRIIEAASFILSHQDMFAGETLRVPSGIFGHKDIDVIEVAKKRIIKYVDERVDAASFILSN